MLRNVVAEFLNSQKERELDLPILFLLQEMGFHDVHLVHGNVEFGKDFIAKKGTGDTTVQYVFQSKAGDISQAEMRNDIIGQLLEAITVPLSHPDYDTDIPLQVVLITSGELNGNAALALQAFNEQTVIGRLKQSPVLYWGKSDLLEHFLSHGLESIHGSMGNAASQAAFLAILSQTYEGRLTARSMEEYSRRWHALVGGVMPSMLTVALEASILTSAAIRSNQEYEALIISLCAVREMARRRYEDSDSVIDKAVHQGLAGIQLRIADFAKIVESEWSLEKNLLQSSQDNLSITTYLVECAQIVEILSLGYFFAKASTDDTTSQEIGELLEAFVDSEPGVGHPLSDRYAVSLLLALLVLRDLGKVDKATKLAKSSLRWLGDRYESGSGLANVESTELEETIALLGSSFDFFELAERRGSLLSTVLADFAAFSKDHELFDDIVNDILALDIANEYWQPVDSVGVFDIGAPDVARYSNVEFRENYDPLETSYGTHEPYEPSTFAFEEQFGPEIALVLMIVNRDRYFPKLWDRLGQKVWMASPA